MVYLGGGEGDEKMRKSLNSFLLKKKAFNEFI
jgi:hypothetical protein